MKEELKKRIKDLTSIIGVSGDEWDVAEYIYHELFDYVDQIEVRNNGQLIAMKKGYKKGARVMISAHMDEVGYCIKAIDENGFAYFDAIGGATQLCLPGRRVLIKGKKGVILGVVGVRAGHLMTDQQKQQSQLAKQSYIDLFVNSREEALELGVFIGATVVPDSPYEEIPHNPDYVVTRAADCRVLCAIIIETMKRLKADDFSGEIFAVFNILEETTIKAISSAVTYIKPDYGIFLDTVPCGDVPDINKMELPLALRKGPVIVTGLTNPAAFLYVTSHPKLVEAAHECAIEAGIAYQEFAFNGARYSTDAVSAAYAGEGMAVINIACPRRYSHSPVEIIHMDDVINIQKLTETMLRRNIDLKMF